MTVNVVLREVTQSDLPIFFEQQLDPDANHMAAFTHADPADRRVFMAHWAKIQADESVVIRTILADRQVAGHVFRFQQFGQPSVGYWLGKDYWGKGIATQALSAFLTLVTQRPLYARAAADNLASLRVLEKCGFVLTGHERAFANARGHEIDEAILVLR